MVEAERRPDPGRHEHLSELLEDVLSARRMLERARHDKRVAEQQQHRAALLGALEAYADALAAAGAPLPHRLRTEIDLYRGLGNRG